MYAREPTRINSPALPAMKLSDVTAINFVDIVHGHNFHLRRRFGTWVPPPFSDEKPVLFVPIDIASPYLQTFFSIQIYGLTLSSRPTWADF
jgi:hypothetical protein